MTYDLLINIHDKMKKCSSKLSFLKPRSHSGETFFCLYWDIDPLEGREDNILLPTAKINWHVVIAIYIYGFTFPYYLYNYNQ